MAPRKRQTDIQASSQQQDKNIQIRGQVVEHSSDSPHIPVVELEILHKFKPEAVD